MNKNTTYDVPPTFPTFNATMGVLSKDKACNAPAVPDVSVTPAASVTPAIPATTTTATPIIIQMPSFQYPYSFSNNSDTGPTHSASLPITNNELPSINEFLFSLDQKYNCNNVYSKFESAFLEEEITVNAIKDLSDEQMQKLGIVKIGWQKNIRQAAQRY